MTDVEYKIYMGEIVDSLLDRCSRVFSKIKKHNRNKIKKHVVNFLFERRYKFNERFNVRPGYKRSYFTTMGKQCVYTYLLKHPNPNILESWTYLKKSW